MLACVLLFGIPARRRKWRTMLGMVIFFVALAGGLASCGGGGSGGTKACTGAIAPGTTPGAYIVTVTGTSGGTTATAPGHPHRKCKLVRSQSAYRILHWVRQTRTSTEVAEELGISRELSGKHSLPSNRGAGRSITGLFPNPALYSLTPIPSAFIFR